MKKIILNMTFKNEMLEWLFYSQIVDLTIEYNQ